MERPKLRPPGDRRVSEAADLSVPETIRVAKRIRSMSRPTLRRCTEQRHAKIIAYFRAVLEDEPHRTFDMLELCETLGVSDRTVRTCCDEVLAASPAKYLRTQRMHLARCALARADPLRTTVTDIAISHGFSELGRFSVRYRAMFGEQPCVTLRRRSVE